MEKSPDRERGAYLLRRGVERITHFVTDILIGAAFLAPLAKLVGDKFQGATIGHSLKNSFATGAGWKQNFVFGAIYAVALAGGNLVLSLFGRRKEQRQEQEISKLVEAYIKDMESTQGGQPASKTSFAAREENRQMQAEQTQARG